MDARAQGMLGHQARKGLKSLALPEFEPSGLFLLFAVLFFAFSISVFQIYFRQAGFQELHYLLIKK